jgi:hypothetical protein
VADETHSPLEPGMAQDAEQDPSGSALKRFWGTPLGKYVLGGAAVLALLIVAAAAVGVFMLSTSSSTSGKVTVQPTPPAAPAPSPTPSASAEVSVAAPAEVPVTNEDVFVFRDPFIPLMKAKPAVTASSSVSTTTTAADKNTLTLQDVVTENGVDKAVVVLGGVTYTVGEGQQVGESPWKVLTIDGTTVVMLFGDDRVTLTVGQGVQK